MLWLSSADFISKLFFPKKSSRNTFRVLSGVQIRTDVLLVLIWVQTVCKGYQQATKVAASIGKVKKFGNIEEVL